MSQQNGCVEIERRWLLSGPPNSATLETLHKLHIDGANITTVYILADPQLEVRIRRRRDLSGRIKFTVVMKIGQGLARQESPNLSANEALFNYYFELFKSSQIFEEYWKILLQIGKELEIKWLKGPGNLNGLVLAEVEFKSKDIARQFSEQDFPAWLKPLIIKEVTDDPRYNGKNLVVHGRPDPI